MGREVAHSAPGSIIAWLLDPACAEAIHAIGRVRERVTLRGRAIAA